MARHTPLTYSLLCLAFAAGCSSGSSRPLPAVALQAGAGTSSPTPSGGAPSTSPSGAPPGAGVLIVPDVPPVSSVTFALHAHQEVQPISRHVYGVNGHSWGGRPANLTLDRRGGNRWSAYDWETNASNAGTDWHNQNDAYLESSNVPGEAARKAIAAAHANGAACLITVPMLGHVASDKSGGGDVNQTANYLLTRFHASHARKPTPLASAPDTNDANVYQDEFVALLDRTFPGAWTDPDRAVFVSLDNEPGLWAGTHPRLRSDAVGSSGVGVTYGELVHKTIEHASAIKDVAPGALVFGPVSYGWQGMLDLQNASDAAGRDFLDTYLGALRAAEGALGRRLLDVLDVHWYPEATGGGVRVTSDSGDPAVAAARVQAPRSLWDPTYVEDSWITQWSTAGAPIRLLPRLQDKLDVHYPGTRMAVTEYYYGGGDHISGGIAQADALGIFGREGVFAACLWRIGGSNHSFVYGGFDMFRDYDQAGGAFGDTSFQATNSDPERTSVYASLDAGRPDRVVVVCINKTPAPLTAGISLTHTERFTQAEVYQLTAAASTPQRVADLGLTLTNAFQYEMPASSVTTLVLRP